MTELILEAVHIQAVIWFQASGSFHTTVSTQSKCIESLLITELNSDLHESGVDSEITVNEI